MAPWIMQSDWRSIPCVWAVHFQICHQRLQSRLNQLLLVLMRTVHGIEIMLLDMDLSVHAGRLAESERHLGGKVYLDSYLLENGDRFLRISVNNQHFQPSTNFRHFTRCTTTWQPRTHPGSLKLSLGDYLLMAQQCARLSFSLANPP